MASVKATFTLDEETALRLSETARRLNRPKSAVVRDAIHEYSERADRLSANERRLMLAAFDELVPKIPRRPAAEVDAELSEIRESRRRGGRRAGG
jgi:predicted transcriptional regulator